MTTDVLVPVLGESVVEATVSSWLVKPGDPVKAGDILAELETDKVSLEIEAPADGVVQAILAEAGTDVSIGDVIATIAESDGGAAPAPVVESQPAPSIAS